MRLAATVGIVQYVRTHMSNALAEGISSEIRVTTEQAYAFAVATRSKP